MTRRLRPCALPERMSLSADAQHARVVGTGQTAVGDDYDYEHVLRCLGGAEQAGGAGALAGRLGQDVGDGADIGP